MSEQRKLGLVLGAGVARGWAHIGVLRALDEIGLQPDIVCGCSSGALVGASYVTGHLTTLEELAVSLTWTRVLGYMDLSLSGGGLIEGRWIVRFFERNIGDTAIEDAHRTFGAVATELSSGRETWLTTGSIIDAVRASIAMPGLITPIRIRGHWLVDGALVNPFPVSLCRSLGADLIIGVNLSGSLASRASSVMTRPEPEPGSEEATAPPSRHSTWLEWLSGRLNRGEEAERSAEAESSAEADAVRLVGGGNGRPGYVAVLGQSFFVVQDFVSRIRSAADPVDIMLAPDVSNIGIMDFHRAEESIAVGHSAVMGVKDELAHIARQLHRN